MSQSPPHLNLLKTINSVSFVKHKFSDLLKSNGFIHIPAPLILESSTSLNDDLADESSALKFKTQNGDKFEVFQSLAKWKRDALCFYCIDKLYTDMVAIRRMETLSPLYSYIVDQWDWEIRVPENVNDLNENYNNNKNRNTIQNMFCEEERESKIAKEKKAIFLTGIGHKLKSGQPHDIRAVDYDDWNLNGDIIFYSDPLETAIEMSSMGIRVDENSLKEQLEISGKSKSGKNDVFTPFQKKIIDQKIPLSVGGCIGQSRVAMFMLERKHIAEVQVGTFSQKFQKKWRKEGVDILYSFDG
ncbi:aspartate--ammonia ligase-like [Lepeophtheirus salmonis]|uniref:aspartate--ammonia ligase-like n=1 Tax=Lepeophtheirus salmonis TaxID=72036 RepID=UPI001AEB80E0|nr:aspartate--ammonia ligase-like [Lepeophtheirus salmonis]